MSHILSDHLTLAQAQEVFERWKARSLELMLQILALYRPGRRWRPVIKVEGLENLTDALARGKGVILWNSDFAYRVIMIHVALRQTGFAAANLTRPEHGFSVSPFAMRFLNPLWAAAENRFMAERIMIENNDAGSALKILRDRLAKNKIVVITVSETGRRTYDAKFFHGKIRVATGPVHLARTSGAPLLPVFVLRNEDGIYEVSIRRALDAEDTSEPLYAAAINDYVAMLAPMVLKYSDQWNGWLALENLVENAPDAAAFVGGFDRPSAITRELDVRLPSEPVPG